MKRLSLRWSLAILALVLTAMLISPSIGQTGKPTGGSHTGDPRTRNLHPMGDIVEPRSLLVPGANPDIHTDIAFWGKLAFQGSWLGFNIRDISAPRNPKQVSFTSCKGNQGDIVVWENILVRAWNVPAGAPGVFGAGLICDGVPVPAGFEGLHIFDISNPADPVLVGSVNLSAGSIPVGCGSHTLTAVPDLANNRLLIYNSSSATACPWIDIVEIPLAAPGSPTVLSQELAFRAFCHDTAVILGDAMLAACAGGNGFTLWSINPADLDDLDFIASVPVPIVPPVVIGHSAAFTWDGEVLIFGHEPGGGVAAACQATFADLVPPISGNPVQTDEMKSLFFFDTDGVADDGTPVGTLLGKWTLPRPQSPIENCTIHNFNVVPLRSGRYVLVQGSYQSGTSVVDFTDLANPVEIAWSDPPPIGLVPPPLNIFCGGLGCEIGGPWSSYWYNNFIYETNITEGLNIFGLSHRATAGAIRLDHLNPQTQEFTID